MLNSKQQNTPQITTSLAKLGCKVIARISVCPITVSDSPRCSAVEPQLRQTAGMLAAMCAKAWLVKQETSDKKRVIN